MYKLYPYFTNDGSVGLYSPKDCDIYHSTYGALTEAYEKFVLPSNPEFYIQNYSEIKILDICYGIGYNSKSFFNYIIQKKFNNEKQHIATIDNNNINSPTSNYAIDNDNNFTKECQRCSEKIDNDNTFCKNAACNTKEEDKLKIYIKAIDTDKVLAFLSPFVICDKKNLPKDYKLPFDNEKISKLLNKITNSKIKFSNLINVIFFEKIAEKYPEIFENRDIISILTSKSYSEFFEPYIRRLFKFNNYIKGNNATIRHFYTFLHNIYYHYISNRHKKALKCPIFDNFIFDLEIKDARQELLEDKNLYNLIFLDAFTPAKCPALWSVDFFRLLFEHLDDNGRILTYSNSAAIRNAFLEAGFFIGKIYNPSSKKFMGTIAVKNKTLIKHELSDYDLGLLKTKAGIFYRDENLNALNEQIIAAHKSDVENSDLISSSKFIKQYKSIKND